MKPKKAVKELEKQLRKDPENLVLRLRLAAALRELGRTDQAVTLYRSVAVQYHSEGRVAQAVAVCRSVLEIDASHRDTQALLAELEARLHAHVPDPDPTSPDPDPTSPPPTTSAPQAAPPPPPPAPPPPKPIPPGPPTARNVRVIAPPKGGLPSPPSGDDFAPSGLTPSASDLEVPSLAGAGTFPKVEPRRKSDPVIDQNSRPPGVRSKRRSQAMAAQAPPPRDTTKQSHPPRMKFGPSSKLLITPTPLPPPSAYDDDDDDSLITNPNRPPPRARPPSPPPLQTPTGEIPSLRRPAPSLPADDVDDDAMTTVAPEAGWRPPAVPVVPSQQRPTAPLEDVAKPSAPARELSPAVPAGSEQDDVFGESTRFGDSLAEVGGAALRPPEPQTTRRRHRRTTRNTLPMGGKPEPQRVDDARATNPLLEPTAAPPRGKPISRSFDADDDATRVDNGLPSMMKPGMDDFEVVDDDDEGMGLERAFDGTFSEAIDSLAPDGSAIDTPLTIFSELPEDALTELVRRMILRSFRTGDIVLREGDPGDACFVIASGSVRVLKRDPANQASDLIEVARLGSGSVFGEFALLADRRRHATVQAIESTELYEIPRRLLRELAATYPDVGPALEKFYRERLLSTLLATAPFFGPLAEDRRAKLLARFKPMRCESGEQVIIEGQKAGGLYLIVLGAVEIMKKVGDNRSVLLTTLGEGAYFGELSLMRGGSARAGVKAIGPTELAVLPPDDFYELVAANPVLWEELRKEAHRRELMLSQIVTGETNVV